MVIVPPKEHSWARGPCPRCPSVSSWTFVPCQPEIVVKPQAILRASFAAPLFQAAAQTWARAKHSLSLSQPQLPRLVLSCCGHPQIQNSLRLEVVTWPVCWRRLSIWDSSQAPKNWGWRDGSVGQIKLWRGNQPDTLTPKGQVCGKRECMPWNSDFWFWPKGVTHFWLLSSLSMTFWLEWGHKYYWVTKMLQAWSKAV